MGLKKCKKCKKIFAPTMNSKVCPACIQKEEEQYKIVKDYLWDHPGATILQIHEATGISEKLIQKFVREGRFLQINGVDLMVECERCGKKISSGRFCTECRNKLKDGIDKVKSVSSKELLAKKKADDKMYINERFKRK